MTDKYNLKASTSVVKVVKDDTKEDDQNSFKYVQRAMIKNVLRQMYRFVRLVDFIIMDVVRRLVVNAVEKLQTYITASFTGIFESKNDPNNNWSSSKDVVCPPLFKISLLLCQGSLSLL